MPERKAPLSVVGGAKPRTARTRKPPAQKSVKAAAASGTPRELLVAVRDRIAATIDKADTPPRDLAALTRRLMDIAKEINALDAAERSDDVGNAAATPDASWPAT
jgi:hypothetical protein